MTTKRESEKPQDDSTATAKPLTSLGVSEGEAEASPPVKGARRRTSGTKTREQMQAMALLSAEARRKKAAERAEAQKTRAHTFRQRIGVALEQATQEELNAAVRSMLAEARKGDSRGIAALARLADQSFGRSAGELPDTDKPYDELTYQEMSPAQRAAYRAALLAERDRAMQDESASGDVSDPRDSTDQSGDA